jgi:hypothetical protein
LRRRQLRCDLDGCVEVPGLDEQELDKLSLAPGSRAVCERQPALHNPEREGAIRLQVPDVDQVQAADQVLFAGLAGLDRADIPFPITNCASEFVIGKGILAA